MKNSFEMQKCINIVTISWWDCYLVLDPFLYAIERAVAMEQAAGGEDRLGAQLMLVFIRGLKYKEKHFIWPLRVCRYLHLLENSSESLLILFQPTSLHSCTKSCFQVKCYVKYFQNCHHFVVSRLVSCSHGVTILNNSTNTRMSLV